MARIYPFRAWRYNPSTVKLDDVVTQPYDMISPAMQQAYYQRSPYNLVRVVLGLPELFDAGRSESVYSRAASDFRAWREQGVLLREKEPCVYAYTIRFRTPASGALRERRGFIALGRIEDYSDGIVFRHEGTLPRPKSDRLNLLRATRAHFGQIFMLYFDPAKSVDAILYDGKGPADLEVTDEYGTVHLLWRVSDPATIRLLIAEMADKRLIIADGHHRYQAALDYRGEHAPPSPDRAEHPPTELPHPEFPEAATMMTFVNLDSDGLVILPIHRIVCGLREFDAAAFFAHAREFFDEEPLASPAVEASLARLTGETGPAMVVLARGRTVLWRLRRERAAAAFPQLPPSLLETPVALLDAIVFGRLLGIEAGGGGSIGYCVDALEARDAVEGGQADLAFLLNPVTIDQVREVALAGLQLPQKSTNFHPKMLSGLAIHALD